MSSEEIWQAAEKLTSPEPVQREQGLEFFHESEFLKQTPLLAYLVGTRITDPDLQVRFHAVQTLGWVLDGERGGGDPEDQVLRHLHELLKGFRKEDYISLMEVSVAYLAAEEDLCRIFHLCSFAGGIFSGIVNDRKVDLPLRQKAIYFSGKAGFLETLETLKRFAERLDAAQGRSTEELQGAAGRQAELETLYPAVVAAIDRLTEKPLGAGGEQA